jgi:hypothetical protein
MKQRLQRIFSTPITEEGLPMDCNRLSFVFCTKNGQFIKDFSG